MNRGAYAILCKPTLHLLAFPRSDDILVKHMSSIFPLHGANNPAIIQNSVINRCNLEALCIPFIQNTQFHPQDRRLNFVKTTIPTFDRADEALVPSVFTKESQLFGDPRVVCNNATAIAKGCEIFCWIKTKSGRIPKGADLLPSFVRIHTVLRPVGLCTVFDNP